MIASVHCHARNWLSNDLLTGADSINETQEETSTVLGTKKRYGAESNRVARRFSRFVSSMKVLEQSSTISLDLTLAA